MSVVIITIFGAMMIGAAIFAVYSRSLLSAIISSGVISLLASIIYILLAAPDVAMTEAAIGSGLTTVVFLLALRRIYAYAGAHDRAAGGSRTASDTPDAGGSPVFPTDNARSAEEAVDD